MNEKIFVGNVKTVETKFGSLTKLGFKEADLEVLREHLSNGWVNVAIMTSQKTGNPYMVIDTYKREQQAQQAQPDAGIEEEVFIPEGSLPGETDLF